MASDVLRLAAADLVLLVKPQFEAGRNEADRARGVIRDPAVWQRALLSVAAAMRGGGAALMGMMVSPITGAAGNVEFFLHMRVHSDNGGFEGRDLDACVIRVMSQALEAGRASPDRGGSFRAASARAAAAVPGSR